MKKTVFLGLIVLMNVGVAVAKQPNLLLIVADDLGFSDIGCYGGEIATPNLDRLAAEGLRFTQCYNTARCWPTRSALMTGYYPQQTRSDPRRQPLPTWTRLLPHGLKDAGYRSYHSGKWHVTGVDRIVQDAGFDHSYVLDDPDRNFYPHLHGEDDRKLAPIQKGATNYYTSVVITDHAIRCLAAHAERYADQPFFSYVAYTVPHFPLQAPEADIARYRKTYLQGWEVARRARFERLTQMGIVSCGLSEVERTLGPPYRFPNICAKVGAGEVDRPLAWETLTDVQKVFQAEKMAIHAAMVHVMDVQIGRIVEQVRSMRALEDTLILFLSDNGASAEMMIRGDGHDPAAPMGSGPSYLCLGPGWSTVANTPFRRHKTWVHEGGISTPLIVHWPKGFQGKNELRRDLCHVIDVVPTLLAVAGVQPKMREGAPAFPGVNLQPAFLKDGALKREALFFSHEENKALRDARYKLVAAKCDGDAWELYDLSTDRCEQRNLAAQQPERVKAMSERWFAMDAQFAKDGGDPTFMRDRGRGWPYGYPATDGSAERR